MKFRQYMILNNKLKMKEVSLNLIPDNEVKYIYYSLLHNKYEKKQINKLFKYFSLSIESLEDANKLLAKEAIRNKYGRVLHRNRYGPEIKKNNHPFVTNNDVHIANELCDICGETFKEHFFNIDGKKSHSVQRKEGIKIEEEIPKIKRRNSVKMRNITTAKITKKIHLCQICLEEDKKKFTTFKCSHDFCSDCVYSYLFEKIKIGDVPIKCPEKECNYYLDEDVIIDNTSEEVYQKYKKFIRRKEIEKIPGAVPCPLPNCESYALRPSASIDNGVIDAKEIILQVKNHNEEGESLEHSNTNDTAIILRCIDNNHEFCSKCLLAPHPGVKCSTNVEQGFSNWKKRNDVRLCPQCGIEIQKLDGCNHMTCSKCKYQFCWICGGKYSNNHYNNPLSPCFRMQYSKSNSLFARNCFLRILKIIGCILLFFIGIGLVLCLPGMIMIGFVFYMTVNHGFGDNSCIIFSSYFFTALSLGIALNFMGYIVVAGAIMASPGFIIFLYLDGELCYDDD